MGGRLGMVGAWEVLAAAHAALSQSGAVLLGGPTSCLATSQIRFCLPSTQAHLSRIEPAVGNEVAHPFVGPFHLPGCFQIDCPRVPQFSVSIESVE